MISVLMMASGAAWEADAFGQLTAAGGIAVLKRCVDVDDLLATSGNGQADIAVVGLDAPGLDPAAIAHLGRYAVRPVAVVSPSTTDPDVLARAERLGIAALVAVDDLGALADVVVSADGAADTRVHGAESLPAPVPPPNERGRLVAVWGPGGAPGRTTLAVAVAAELARRAVTTRLIDADPYGGGVAQHLGVLDEVSGLLSAARLAGAGELTERFPTALRAVSPHLAVLTGLPRADRWVEVRGSQLESILDQARESSDVVIDTGFSIEGEPGNDFGARPARNTLTTTTLQAADEVLVVGLPDPPGLTRLARALVDLRDVVGAVPVRVVINRMRGTLGWSEREIAGMVEGFARTAGLHFLPEDQAVADRAIVSGVAVSDAEDSSLARSIARLVDALFPASVVVSQSRRGRRRSR